MGIDALGDPGCTRHLADDLADALAGQGVRHRGGTLLAAGEQPSGPAGADVQPEQLGQLAADRHLAPFAALALANDHDALGKADTSSIRNWTSSEVRMPVSSKACSISFEDVMAYKAEHRRARRAVLDELSRLDQELGLT